LEELNFATIGDTSSLELERFDPTKRDYKL